MHKNLKEIGIIQDVSKLMNLWYNNGSHRRCSVRKVVLRNFTGKHLCQSLFFNKVAGLMQQVRLWHRYFPVNFVKLLRAPFLQNTSERQLLDDGDDSVLLDYDRFMWIEEMWPVSLCEKCSNTEFFLVRIFPYSDWIQGFTE